MTGAGRGIGRAIALGLAAAGANVSLVARNAVELDQTAALIEAGGGRGLVVPADLADPGAAEHVVAATRTTFGAVDLLINNAAVIGPLGPTATVDVDAWAAALALNVTAVVRLTLLVLPDMLARGWGRVIDISSGAAADPLRMPRANAYVTTKTAVEAHALNLAAELTGTGVTLNVYRPGIVDTAMQAGVRSLDPEVIGGGLVERFAEYHSGRHLLSPEDTAKVLLHHLATDANGEVWDARDPAS